MGCFDVRNPEAVGQPIDPRRLDVHGRTEGLPPLVRKDNQLRALSGDDGAQHLPERAREAEV